MTRAEFGEDGRVAQDRAGAPPVPAPRGGRASPVRAIEWALLAAAVILVSVITSFHAPFDAPFTDLFHEGEYLAPRLFFEAGIRPLLIHGYINYLPSELAALVCGVDRLVACTRAVNAGASALAAIGFFGCALALARSREAMLLIALGVIAMLLLINGRLADSVALQQGSPSVRETALLAMLLCILAVPGRRPATSDLLAGAAGLIAGLSLFWAYNRGLIGVAVLPLYSLSSLLVGRGWRHALAPLAGLALGMALAGLAEPAMWRQHLLNILYWAQNNDIWRYPFSLRRTAFNLPFYIVVAAILLWALRTAFRLWRDGKDRDELPSLLVLTAITLLLVQQTINRDDPAHIMWVAPWLFLLVVQLIRCSGLEPQGSATWSALFRRRRLLLIGAAAVLWLDFAASTSVVRPMFSNTAKNLLMLLHGVPRDLELTPPETRAIAAALRATGQACTYVFNNAGGLYHLADQRPCSPVMYPVYAARDAERRVIADLSGARPTLVVGQSADWFSSIDGKELAERTPSLAAWLGQTYRASSQTKGTDLRRLAGTEFPAGLHPEGRSPEAERRPAINRN